MLCLSLSVLEAGSLNEPGARLVVKEPHNLPVSASHSSGVLGAHVTLMQVLRFKFRASCFFVISFSPAEPSSQLVILTFVLGVCL